MLYLPTYLTSHYLTHPHSLFSMIYLNDSIFAKCTKIIVTLSYSTSLLDSKRHDSISYLKIFNVRQRDIDCMILLSYFYDSLRVDGFIIVGFQYRKNHYANSLNRG